MSLLNNIDQINLGTAKTIQTVVNLPTIPVNQQQHSLYKVATGEVYRLIRPLVNEMPAPSDFELLVPTHGGATRFLWNTWINGSTLANGNVTNTGATNAASFSATVGYGYRLTTETTGSVGSIWWQLPQIDWPSLDHIKFKTSIAANGAAVGAAAGDGPFMYIGGSSAANDLQTVNSGLGVWVCWYSGTPKVEVYDGATLLYTQILYNADHKINSATVFETGIRTNFYDLEMVLSRYGNKRILTVLVNGSMIMQLDVSAWTPLGNICTVGARCGAAIANQYARSFEANW